MLVIKLKKNAEETQDCTLIDPLKQELAPKYLST